MFYIGIDLAWSKKNPSYIIIAQYINNTLTITHNKYLLFEEITQYIDNITTNQKTIIAIDAPIIINNELGNRQTEIDFLKDFSKYKLGAYPVNKTLFMKIYKSMAGVDLYNQLKTYNYKIGLYSNKNIIEVYPHATIMTLYNNMKVLPYKYKKGRSKEFIKEQLLIYSNFLKKDIYKIEINLLDNKTFKSLKNYEDYLDSINCTISAYYAVEHNNNLVYGNINIGLLLVPNKK